MAYDAKRIYYRFDDYLSRLVLDYEASRQIDADSEQLYHGFPTEPYDENLFVEHNVKRGLRNADGSGVVAGLTRISDVHGYKKVDGRVIPDKGQLRLRGYQIGDLVTNAQREDRFGYEEVAYLLLTGSLPTVNELKGFCERIGAFRHLSGDYLHEFPMTTPSRSIMNTLARAVLLLYRFDAEPDEISPEHEIDVAMAMLARLPRIAAFAHMTRVAKAEGQIPRIPQPDAKLSTAETVLQVLRGGDDFTHDEAMLLDVMLMLHAEHGGGNNSTFTMHVVTSSGTDTYSAIAAAIGALKGPKHGGANLMVNRQLQDIREHVARWDNDDEVASYLEKILDKEAFDRTGLIYGMGHAVYTLSDPRAELCRKYARKLADAKGVGDEFSLIERIERLAPEVMRDHGFTKPICANIDLYTGFIYQMLGIPDDLFTPMFAVARMAGWSAHRMEELFCAHRIIRPAYNPIMNDETYVPLSER